MALRELLYRWRWPIVIVLPAWLVIGWLVFDRHGWTGFGLFFVAPATFVTLAVLTILVQLRPGVRKLKALAWLDVGFLMGMVIAVVGIGFYKPSSWGFGLLAVLAAVAWFWFAVSQLSSEGQKRMNNLKSRFEEMAGAEGSTRPPADRPGVIIVNESVSDQHRPPGD